jgi:PAS domain S-box-containing protein
LHAPGGDMGAAIRAKDWTDTPVGPREHWPQALRAALSLMLNSPESLYLLWGPQRLFFFNDAYRPILGPRLPGALGNTVMAVWPDAWEQVRDIINDAFAGQACRFENQPLNLSPHGEPERTCWSFSFSPVYDDAEREVLGVLCHAVDTTQTLLDAEAKSRTDRHAAHLQANLHDAQELNARVLASSSDCIKVLSLDGELVFMSDGGMRVMEISDFNAVQGCPWPDFWKDQGNLEATAAIAAAKAGRNARFQGAAETFMGNLKWWDVQVTPIRNAAGLPEKILCVSRDITALRTAEEQLRRANAQLQARVEARTQDRDRIWQLSTDLMLVARFDGTMTAVNPAWTDVLGWQADELLGQSFHRLLHPDDDIATAGAVEELASGVSIPRFENRYRHKDGSYRWLSWTAVPGRGFIHAIGRNIDNERRAAQTLRKTEEALRQSQKLEAIGQLTGGVAHDFNNLLTVIRSSVDLLKRNLDEGKRKRYTDAIADTVERAAKLTGQLLAFARQQNLRPETFEVGASVRAIGEMIGALTGARIQVRIELPQQACYINADSGQFDTALVNMAVNARDAMRGEGSLTIRVTPVLGLPALRAHAPRSGDYIAVAIEDSGDGIGAEDLERIFEPFFTTKEIGKGTGLGLSQVFGFAKQSGGEVTVTSQLGQGSCFTLYLPRSDAAQVVSLAPLSEQVGVAAGTRLLVVEDNPQVGEFANQSLTELGYSTHWARNADDALSALAGPGAPFQAVFSDVVMPGTNGVELAVEIRRLYPDLPVVLTSGYSPALSQSSSQALTFLQKPYSVEALARILHEAINPRG